MALSFGWRANDIRESIWRGDPALKNVPAAAIASWQEDGDASHLEPYATDGKPTKITFRTLTADETRIISGYFVDSANALESYLRAILMCFRIAVDFPEEQERIQTPDGAWHNRIAKERGLRMLAQEYVKALEETYPGIVMFYGELVFKASMATEIEKKASSPPSTPTPSSEAVTTAAVTDVPPTAGAA